MATILERYSVAIHSKSLVVDGLTDLSNSDVLGAMGLADRRLTDGYVPTGRNDGYHIKTSPLSAPLTRLMCGDNHAVRDVVRILAKMAWSKAESAKGKGSGFRVTRVEAHDLACACLAWHRSGTCRTCNGHGYDLVPGTGENGDRGVLSERECRACDGAGKIPFERSLDPDGRRPHLVSLARWLLSELERSMGRAGQEAMKAIRPSLDL